MSVISQSEPFVQSPGDSGGVSGLYPFRDTVGEVYQ